MKAATLSLLLLVALRAPSRASEEILFEDPLASRLRDGWSWVREEPASWRLTPHGLEMRVRPGNLWGPRNDSVNVLVRPAPAPVPGRLEICVTVSNRPTHQYEQANLAWYHDDRHMVKLGLELVNGEVCIVMGREEGDRTRTLAKIPVPIETVRLRLRIEGTRITGAYQPGAIGPWIEAGAGELPGGGGGQPRLSLHCYQGPTDAEHWARFSAFVVARIAGERSGERD